jgi:5-methylcytosine-specific restriction protein A
MKTWILPCKGSTFIIETALKTNLNKESGDTFVDWRQSNDFAVGDVVFIYKTAPESCIRYKMEVTKVGLPFDEATDKEIFWKDKAVFYDGLGVYKYVRFHLLLEYPAEMFKLEALQRNGLIGNIRAVTECNNEQLLAFLNGDNFNVDSVDNNSKEVFENDAFTEGTIHEVVMNRYERSAKARAACLAANGYRCIVCGMDFETTYGEIGHNFIHVHHIVPISSIGEEYMIDGVRDLVPVCPNCHNMLHRKEPPYTPEELRGHFNK